MATGDPTLVNSLFVGNIAPEGTGIRNNDQDPTIVIAKVISLPKGSRHGPQGSRAGTARWSWW